MSLSTNTTYRVLVEKLGAADPTEFIGNEGEVFYNPSVPELLLSDGSTPGGLSIGGGGGGSSQWTTTGNGIYYQGGNVAIGTNVVSAGSTTLLVQGDARITGILSIGTSTITLNPNDNTISIGDALTISAENNTIALGVTGDIRRSDMGVTGIATETGRLPGTFNFSGESESGQRITTTAESGTVTVIPHSLTGPGIALTEADMVSGSTDDGAWELNIPFDIEFIGITTNIAYLTTNSYITFTDYATDYSVENPAYAVPALPKIMVSAGDAWSSQMFYDTFGDAPNRTFCVRYEGLLRLGGNEELYTPNQVVWEAIFYENNPSQIDIQIGSNPRYVSLNDPNVKLNVDGVIGFTDGNIKIGDKTTGRSLISCCDLYGSNNNVFLGVGAGQCTTYGSDNNFIGLQAGRSNTNGSYNNFFGHQSGYCNTTGNHNNFLGYQAGFNNCYGDFNNFLGVCVGFNNTIGCHNNFFGICAGFSNTTGCYNNFFGRDAGQSNTSGSFNNFLGFSAGRSNTTGNSNNFSGDSAGCFNTSGSYNNFFGINAGRYNTTGNSNNFSGDSAGCSNTSGSYNNFFGFFAGRYNTTGFNNNFLGINAGRYNTTGCYNTFLGAYSGGISTSASNKIILGRGNGYNESFDSPDTTKDTQFAVGVRTDANPANYWIVGNENFNVGIGTTNPQYKLDVGGDINFTGTLYQDGTPFSGGGGGSGAFSYCCTNNITSSCLTSHPDITTACHNFFAGVGAGCSITSGRFNNFFGLEAGRCNTTGRQNNFIGRYAGRCNTTGSYNSFFGDQAGFYNTNVCLNTFIGAFAGYYNSSGSCNNFFGVSAGYENITGTDNSFFGNYSGWKNTTGSNNSFFGSFTGRSTSASRKVIIGSGYNQYNQFDSPDITKDTQFAVGMRTDTNPSKYWLVGNENFNIGIGTTNPTQRLEVQNGNIKVGVNTSNGLILTDANGVSWRLIVNTDGTLTTAAV